MAIKVSGVIQVAGAMIVREGRVLLGRRAPHRRICPDSWDLIGGHVEFGESHEAALVRELYEEIGVTPTRFAPVTMIDFSAEAGEAVHFHLFRVEAFDGEPRLADDEHTALRWFSFEEAAALPDLASARYRPILLAEAGRMHDD